MGYDAHFKAADDLIAHLSTVYPDIKDPVLKAKYVGFLTVSVVTVFELCIKELLVAFAAKKHRAFGAYCANAFDRMNGRISLKDLRDSHIKRFGDKYVKKFDLMLNDCEMRSLKDNRISLKSSYGNVIVWRNSFAHEGVIPPNASFEEATKGYNSGREIIECLSKAMVR